MKVEHTPESLKYRELVHSLLGEGLSEITIVRKLHTDYGLSLDEANRAVSAVHYELRDKRKSSN